MKLLSICIIASHSFPIPYKNLHTGDLVILQLAKSLLSQGHNVWLCAPEGTDFVNLLPMPTSYGRGSPTSKDCEIKACESHMQKLLNFDIIHDFSAGKVISKELNKAGFNKTCVTLMGGPWREEYHPNNLVVWSKAHKERVLRGATDYENTTIPLMGGEIGYVVKNAHVVYGGIDTEFYSPADYSKDDYMLWMGRWHPARGYELAIDLAKQTGIKLVLAGEHPDNELFEYQKSCAKEAVNLAKGFDNISFNWLPLDPDHHIVKRELYRKAKAFIYSVQFHEPFGLSQAEALACGTPVIATNYGSMPEVINNNVTGYICNNSVEEFHNAINKIDDINIIDCRNEAVNRFDISIMAKNYLNEYRAIVGGASW